MLTKIVDYDYYSKNYGGSSIPESSFQKYSIKASSKVNFFTFNRISSDNLTDIIKNTVCEIAEVIYSQDMKIDKVENDSQKEVVSETVGPHSKTFSSKSSLLAQRILSSTELDYKCYEICYQKIADTGLMFRGQDV